MQYILDAIFLGLIQGLTEFIPVSSSGHLIILEQLLGSNFGGLSYDVVVHLGTLLALLIYFRKDLWQFARVAVSPTTERKLLGYLIIATVPAVVTGFFWQDVIETTLRSLWVVVVMMVALALVMFIADRRPGSRELSSMNLKDAVLIGASQALALIPGTSRSGATIVAGSLLGYNNAESARFSFYLAIPILLGANLRVFSGEGVAAEFIGQWPAYVVGFVVAALSGYLVIAVLLKYLSTHKLAVFAWYRIGLAAILAITLIF